MKSTALIDGDILLVSTGFALETETEWEDDVWSLTVDLKEWKKAVDKVIKGHVKDLLVSDYIICLSQGTTFRHDIYPAYKGNRKGRKPTGLKAMQEWMVKDHDAKIKPGIEADDTMGILATHPRLIEGDKIIVSQDKDLKTIPGTLYRDGDVVEISEPEANYWHLYQTLVGDTTDGYPGCPGVGPKKAEKALEGEPETHWENIVAAYEKAGLEEEDALLQARLARILRYTDYNFKRKEAILWTPKTNSK